MKQGSEVCWELAFKLQDSPTEGGAKPEGLRVQGLPAERGEGRLGALRKQTRPPGGGSGAAVERIAQQRMTEFGEVNADLVSAPGLQATLEEADAAALEAAQDLVGGLGDRKSTRLNSSH